MGRTSGPATSSRRAPTSEQGFGRKDDIRSRPGSEERAVSRLCGILQEEVSDGTWVALDDAFKQC